MKTNRSSPLPEYTEMDDVALLQAITTGQSAALAALYDRYGRLIYSLAMNVLSEPAAAEEVTQDVFVQVWDKASRYDAQLGKVSSWLIGIARNRAIDGLRRRNARPEGHQIL
ncbi:MAG: sigma-70 family RNA polymerase sigma factor [Chloroflexi bacterium]|nr:sigma-70 family RNA polymerase sigma factor [Chloroflexota bacterium]